MTTDKHPTMNISGQCHCGAISFSATVDPGKVLVCHCVDCQTFSGAPFRAVVPAPAAQFKLSGQPKAYVKVAQSGRRRAQCFCGDCGTQLFASEAENPSVYNVRLGCVNERAQLKPVAQIWGRSALAWVPSMASVPTHECGLDSPIQPV